jgi:hypothetical protein
MLLSSANPTTIKDKFLVGYQGWCVVRSHLIWPFLTLLNLGSIARAMASLSAPVRTRYPPLRYPFPLTRFTEPGHHGWIHWFTYPVPQGGHLNTDYWPDTSQYTREELFVAPGFKNKDGSPAHLFSSRNPKTVQRSAFPTTLNTRARLIASCRHFHWMAENGVDGVFLQRFLGLCDVPPGGHDGNRRIRDEVGDLVQRAAEREGRVFTIMCVVSCFPNAPESLT